MKVLLSILCISLVLARAEVAQASEDNNEMDFSDLDVNDLVEDVEEDESETSHFDDKFNKELQTAFAAASKLLISHGEAALEQPLEDLEMQNAQDPIAATHAKSMHAQLVQLRTRLFNDMERAGNCAPPKSSKVVYQQYLDAEATLVLRRKDVTTIGARLKTTEGSLITRRKELSTISSLQSTHLASAKTQKASLKTEDGFLRDLRKMVVDLEGISELQLDDRAATTARMEATLGSLKALNTLRTDDVEDLQDLLGRKSTESSFILALIDRLLSENAQRVVQLDKEIAKYAADVKGVQAQVTTHEASLATDQRSLNALKVQIGQLETSSKQLRGEYLALQEAEKAAEVCKKNRDVMLREIGQIEKILAKLDLCQYRPAKVKAVGTAHAVGDPHLRTFDGRAWDFFNGNSDNVLATLSDGSLEVQERVVKCSGAITCGTAAAIRFNKDVFVVQSGVALSFRLNGAAFTPRTAVWYSPTANTAAQIHVSGRSVVFKMNGITVRVNGWGAWNGPGQYLEVFLDAEARYSTGCHLRGLWGDFNGNAANDAAIGSMNNHWVVSGSRSLFDNSAQRREMTQHTWAPHWALLEESEDAEVDAGQSSCSGDDCAAARKTCKGISDKFGLGMGEGALNECTLDLANGKPADMNEFTRSVVVSQVELQEVRVIAECAAVSSSNSFAPSSGAIDGFYTGLWIKPSASSSGVILARTLSGCNAPLSVSVGPSGALSLNGKDLGISAAVDKWTQIGVSVDGKPGQSRVEVFVNGETVYSSKFVSSDRCFSSVGTISQGNVGGAFVSKVYYVPFVLPDHIVKRRFFDGSRPTGC